MGIVQQITDGIFISVIPEFQKEQSDSFLMDFLFSYEIGIENLSVAPVRLLRRHWYIQDVNGRFWEVDGVGVVGQQPYLIQGARYSYTSSVNLRSELGRMWGYFTMENGDTQQLFKVIIPAFDLVAPFKLN